MHVQVCRKSRGWQVKPRVPGDVPERERPIANRLFLTEELVPLSSLSVQKLNVLKSSRMKCQVTERASNTVDDTENVGVVFRAQKLVP